MTKTIAIIGATGKIGVSLAASLAKGNYRLLLFSHEPEQLTSLVKAIKRQTPMADIEGIGCAVNASWEADIVISTVSLNEKKELAKQIEPFVNRKILISLSSGDEATEDLQRLLPGAKVVKLFNLSSSNKWQQPAVMTGGDEEALQVAEEIFKLAPHTEGGLDNKRA